MTRFLTSLVTAMSAAAVLATGAEARLFDQPVGVQTIKATDGAKPLPEIICTSYADLMIREAGTDTPDPNAATMVPLPDKSPSLACSRAVPATVVRLDTEGFGFLGRTGKYLFFQAADPNGAVAFMVLDAGTGARLLGDGTKDGQITSIATDRGALHMHFTRGVNASCSIPQDATGCWTKLAHDGQIDDVTAKSLPPIAACGASYRESKTPADDPSLVSYEVDLTLPAAGPVEIKPSGPIGCEPMP